MPYLQIIKSTYITDLISNANNLGQWHDHRETIYSAGICDDIFQFV